MEGRRVVGTVVDVARVAGVSTSTVSHVLNGTRTVLPETRDRVLEAIRLTGYRQHSVARALRRARTDSIGLAVSDITNPYFIDVIRGIEAAARTAGYTLLLANAAEESKREAAAIRAFAERRVDGLIVALTAGGHDDVVPDLRRLGIPTVLVDRLSEPGFDQVGVVNNAPTAKLVTHLIDRGHRRIGFVTGRPGLATTTERVTGYRAALARAGIAYDPAFVVVGMSRDDAAEAAVRRMMSDRLPPTAVVAGNNVMALGSLRALRDLGYTVPGQVALVSYDDFPWADLFAPRLTTIAQPSFEIGRQAMRLLLRRIADPDAPYRQVRLKPSLIHRDSCGCPPVRDEPTDWPRETSGRAAVVSGRA
jgi:LacI family transcriptional regulator